MLTCDIFIRSYWKDLAWLEFCLASIQKFCRGFRAVIVVVPRSSRPWLPANFAFAEDVEICFCRDYRDDYLGQQATKLMADSFSDADFICHVDADCIFSRFCTPRDLIIAGKPCVVMRPSALLGFHWPWRKPTETFLGWAVSHDFMQRPPFVFPSWLYPELRNHAVSTHGMDLETYITTRPPRGFSEFNALGAYAHARHHDRFIWLDNSLSDAGEPFCRWYWSWGGIDVSTHSEIQALLGTEMTRND